MNGGRPAAREIAKRAGVSPSTITKIVQGLRPNSEAATLRKIARALRVRYEWLQFGTGPVEESAGVMLAGGRGDARISTALQQALEAASSRGIVYEEDVIDTVERRFGGEGLTVETLTRLLDEERICMQRGLEIVELARARAAAAVKQP